MLYYDLMKNYVNENILIYLPSIGLRDIYNSTLTPINNVPIFMYLSIGITTIVLATVTTYESVGNEEESIFSKLPGVTTESPAKPMVGGSFSKTLKKKNVNKFNKTRNNYKKV